MRFVETPLKETYIIQLEKHEDIRGFFARTFDINDFKEHNIDFNIVQTGISYNKKKGTLRGMHYQDIPYPEEKIVQCIKGSIYDVVLDLRSYSDTFGKWFVFNLSDLNNLILYIPIGIAHGYQTLEDNTTVLYFMNEEYHPECAKTILWNDPKYSIEWKLIPSIMSDRDSSYKKEEV